MVRAARALLSAVTHLLVLADMSDVYKLLLQLKLVRFFCICHTVTALSRTVLLIMSSGTIPHKCI